MKVYLNCNFFLLGLLAIGMMSIVSSCSDDEQVFSKEYQSTAKIIQPDFGLCPCCGGWIVEIDNQKAAYRIEEFPIDFDIEWNESEFPKEVNLDWEVNRNCANITYIDVLAIEYF